LRAVLDANVLVNALIIQGTPPDLVLQALWRDAYEVVTSEPLMREIEGVLRRPWIAARVGGETAADAFLRDFRAIATLVDAGQRLTLVSDDPDNRVLETAIAGSADYIVTGDRALLELTEVRGVEVVRPAEFLRILDEQA
jgi:uncharacterized protein